MATRNVEWTRFFADVGTEIARISRYDKRIVSKQPLKKEIKNETNTKNNHQKFEKCKR